MIRFLINRPVSVIMSFISIIILGIVSINLIPVSLLPNIAIPEITVKIAIDNISVDNIENNYVKPIRDELLHISDLDKISSYSYNGSGYIKLRFNYGTDIRYASIEVNEAIDKLQPYMPEQFVRPTVIKASATDIPIFYISTTLKKSIRSDDNKFIELSEFTENVIKKRFEQLKEVAIADISGMEYPRIELKADMNKLNQLGITVQKIEDILLQNNISMGSINLVNGIYSFNIRYQDLLNDRDDIENLIIKVDNRLVRLGDLIAVNVRTEPGKGNFLNRENKGITMAIIKRDDAKISKLKSELSELIKQLNIDYPEIDFEISRDQTELLDYSIRNLRNSLLIGSILAILVVSIFMQDIKSSILIGISIPIGLAISLFMFYLLDISINIISLSGLILGIGMMIDNSIIVIDNISQKQHLKEGGIDNIVDGTDEVVRPLISSVLTTSAVFIPLIFLSGISGALFYDQAMAVTIGLISSLIVSITLIPVLYKVIFVSNSDSKIKLTTNSTLLESGYMKGYNYISNRKISFTALTFLLIFIGVISLIFIEKERFPTFDQTDAIVNIDWNKNINLEENLNRIKAISAIIEAKTEIVNSSVGEQAFVLNDNSPLSVSEAEIYFDTESNKVREDVEYLITNYLHENYPETAVSISKSNNLFDKLFETDNAPLEVQLWSNGSDIVPKYEQIIDIEKQIYKRLNIKPIEKPPMQQCYQLSLKLDMIRHYNIDIEDLKTAIYRSVNSMEIFRLQQGTRDIPVVIVGEEQDLSERLKNVTIAIDSVNLVSLINFVSYKRSANYKTIYGGKDGVYIPLSYMVYDNNLDSIIAEIDEITDRYSDVSVKYTGSIFSNRDLFNELIIVLIISILLLYFILASQFESVWQPFIVFIEIPIDIAGAVFLLLLTGNSINIMSIIGIIVMIGIIINDSILKIDTINNLIAEGLSLDDAIKVGGNRRLKPIVMTSITTIMAMIPFLWGDDMGTELQKPLAYAVIGGMTIGTFVSLYFIPILYKLTYKGQAKHTT